MFLKAIIALTITLWSLLLVGVVTRPDTSNMAISREWLRSSTTRRATSDTSRRQYRISSASGAPGLGTLPTATGTATLSSVWLRPSLLAMATETQVATSTLTPTPVRSLPAPGLLLERLTRDRPGIWGSGGLYVALGGVYIVLVGVFVAYLIKAQDGGGDGPAN
jgi:hypothetical protein